MAFSPIKQFAHDRLAALLGVIIFDLIPRHRPGDTALVLAGQRYCEGFADSDVFRAAEDLCLGTRLPLAEGMDEEAAFVAIRAFLILVGPLPTHCPPKHADADRMAVAAVLAAFSGASATTALPWTA